MDRAILQGIMNSTHWSKDRCVSFAVRCAESLISHAPAASVQSALDLLKAYVSESYPSGMFRSVDNLVSPIAMLRINNTGMARESCHASLHAIECALSGGASSACGQSARAWAAVNAVDQSLGLSLLNSEGIGE